MSNRSAAKGWLRALELTAPIVNNPYRILSTVIEDLAEKFGAAPALLSDRECLTYRALVERSNRYRSEEHTSELQSRLHLVCRLLLEKKKKKTLTIGVGRQKSILARRL